MMTTHSHTPSFPSRRVLRPTVLLLALAAFAACGSDDDDSDSTTSVGPTGSGTGGSSTGSGGSTTSSGGRGGSTTGSGGSGGSTTGSGGSGGSSDASAGAGGTGLGDASVTPDGGTSSYTFPLMLTPLTSAATSTANISLYFSVTDSKGVGVVGLPRIGELNSTDPFNWVYREDGQDLDPKESGFSVTPLQGNTLDMPTVLVLDLSGSIVGGGSDGGLLDSMKETAKTIIGAMLPEQRMAIVTFAGASTVRMQFTSDQNALKIAVNDLKGDGQSTNLYGAMIDAFGMWQDGFATVGGAKLTAGLAIAITDGKDNAGVKTLADVIAIRQNKRVVSVGIGHTINVDAMKQLASTGTFVQVTDFSTLPNEVGLITKAMSTLGRSIYTANYCTPKLAGSHELLFTLTGNGSTVSTTCTPATFPANQPALCAQAGPQYTKACGAIRGPNSYWCCPTTAPYACPNDDKCHATAAAAAAQCGAAMPGSTGGCVMCGGTGMGSSQDTQLTPGTAIRVKFNATSFKPGQCPEFWGQACKALQSCCMQLPADRVSACNSQLLAALGNETTCQMVTNQYCTDGGADGGTDGSMDSPTDRADGRVDGAGQLPAP